MDSSRPWRTSRIAACPKIIFNSSSRTEISSRIMIWIPSDGRLALLPRKPPPLTHVTQMNRKSATEVELSCPVTKTPDAVTRRYRENRHWRLYPNEWIYRNIPIQGED